MPTDSIAVRRPLDITSRDGAAALAGISRLDDMGAAQVGLAKELGVDAFLDRLLSAVESSQARQAEIAGDVKLSEAGKLEAKHEATADAVARIARLAGPVARAVAKRVELRVDALGIGRDPSDSSINGRTLLEAVFGAGGTELTTMRALKLSGIDAALRALPELEDAELSRVIVHAYSGADVTTIAALEVMTPWQRAELLRRAALDDEALSRLRRGFMASRDPDAYASVATCVQLGRAVIRSSKNAAASCGSEYALLARESRDGLETALLPLTEAVRRYAPHAGDALLSMTAQAL